MLSTICCYFILLFILSGWLASKKDPLFAASSAHRTLIPSFIPKDNYLSRRRIWDHWLVMRLVMTHPLLFVRSTSSHSIDIFPSSSCQTKPFNTWPLFHWTSPSSSFEPCRKLQYLHWGLGVLPKTLSLAAIYFDTEVVIPAGKKFRTLSSVCKC